MDANKPVSGVLSAEVVGKWTWEKFLNDILPLIQKAP